ncbi:MAG: hypothetical protein HY286_07365 [Planctomycetes bacterium]|nr:hypothetical protein [Planctomycetota bacterium]
MIPNMRLERIHSFAAALAIMLLSAPGCAASRARSDARIVTIDFDDMQVGHPPAGFQTFVTGGGVPPAWSVSCDSSAPNGANVLVQSSRDDSGFHFPICIFNDVTARDVAVSVRWKSTAGRMNRSGGIVTRFQDVDHYYLVRFNSLEDNVNLYCYDAPGRRNLITGACHLILAEEEWHTLRVEWRGEKIKVWHDGVFQYEAADATIRAPGRVGLWTKSDSITYFDHLTIENLDAGK